MTTTMNRSMKALHDRLLAEKPDGAVHEPESCPLCAMEDANAGGGNVTTYTEDEVQARVSAAVAEATAPLEAKLNELTQTSETAAAVQAVRAELEPKISDLQTQLDAAVLEAANATAERDSIIAWLEAEKAAQEAEAAMKARMDERITKVKAVASFPDEYLEANKERFAAMSDEDFEVACQGWAALSASRPQGGTIPAGGLHHERESAAAGSSAVKELFSLRRSHGAVDLSSL
jgi:DNA repair exonuclease SbcCD ATPase subunit